MADDLIAQLRALARFEHSDVSLAAAAADEIERLRAAAPGPDVQIRAYSLPSPGCLGGTVAIERVPGHKGIRWAVRDGFGMALSTSGQMDDEPMPSSRTDEWLDEHRFNTAPEAIAAARAWVAREAGTTTTSKETTDARDDRAQ